MSATNALETAIRKIIDEATADATWTALTGASTFYISLHTASPGDAGDQTTSETAYTGYARVAVSRGTDGWTVTAGSSVNDATIAFGQCTASPGAAISYVGRGLSSSGAGTLLEYIALDNAITLQVGSVPEFSAGALAFTAD
jgi:hypothetical protein